MFHTNLKIQTMVHNFKSVVKHWTPPNIQSEQIQSNEAKFPTDESSIKIDFCGTKMKIIGFLTSSNAANG